MLKRLVELARSAVGSDLVAGSVDSFRSTMVEVLKDPPVGGINLGEIQAEAGVADEGRSRSSPNSTCGSPARWPPTA